MKTLITFFLFTAAVNLSGQHLSEAVTKNIEQRIADGTHPSIAIGIIDQSGPVYYNFGTTKKDGEKVDEHTIYEIGSISKVHDGC